MQYSTRMLLLTPTDASCISLTHSIYFYFSSITHIFPSFTARKAPETNYDTKSIQSAGAASIAEQYGAAAVVAPPQAARQSVRSVPSPPPSYPAWIFFCEACEERGGKKGREEERKKKQNGHALHRSPSRSLRAWFCRILVPTGWQVVSC